VFGVATHVRDKSFKINSWLVEEGAVRYAHGRRPLFLQRGPDHAENKTGCEQKFPLNRALNSLENALELVGLGVSAEEGSAPEKLGHDAAA